MSNRKLIRPNLSELKERIQNQAQAPAPALQGDPAPYALREEIGRQAQPIQAERQDRFARTAVHDRAEPMGSPGPGARSQQRPIVRRKQVPPESTAAEAFYYLKQMSSRTQMVVVLMDGEVLHGIIEWYDRYCVKVNREGAPNLLVFKQQVKYMYKADEARGTGSGARSSAPPGEDDQTEDARGEDPNGPEFDRA